MGRKIGWWAVALVAAVLASGLTAFAAAASGARAAAACANRTTRPAQSRADHTRWVDRCGKPFYVDPTEPAVQAATPAETAPYPYADTFTLHSRPGSQRTIYLDFHGATISGTAWNSAGSFAAPAFDTDDDPTTFSSAERDVIQSVWQRVAEDYAPFDVDVTTADPGAAAITRSSSSDAVYGTRLLVTDANGPGSDCGCGGIAYVGVFDESYSHDYYQPAFVFYPAVFDAKSIGEAAAHEVGHTLGLSHDGTQSVGYYSGQGSWAPIMGVGYYRPISQWSRGEYTGANNTEDDLAVIAAHGAAVRADDHGNSAATATPLGASAPGVIERTTDTDWFSFTTGGGATTVTVTPAPVGPDLDAALIIHAADGSVVATVDPPSAKSTADVATGLGASFAGSLAAGSYYAEVDGVGNGDPAGTGYSDYASLGQYTITLSTPAVPPTTDPPPVTPPPVTPPPVNPPPVNRPPAGVSPTVTTAALPGATRGVAYAAQLAAGGGSPAYRWTIAGGALPSGLRLSTGGRISGVPSARGPFTVRVAVTDTDGRRATRSLTLRVAPRPRISTTALPAGRRHRAYAKHLVGADGTLPYHWVVSSGRLPAGLRLTAHGTLRGTPRARGRWAFTVALLDRWRAVGHRRYSVRVR